MINRDLPKQYPYHTGQLILVACGVGTQVARVIEDCGHKFNRGATKYDYVRCSKYNRLRKKWMPVTRVMRHAIFGIVNEDVI